MGPTWPFLLMYGSRGMRHTGFPQVDDGQQDPRDRGVTVEIKFGIMSVMLIKNLMVHP